MGKPHLMDKQPLVSIIIPVYNTEKYLAGSITSAVSQTWPNKEIIVVDDGSTDQSLKVAKGFASDAVSVFSCENKGASAARNFGLHLAKGDYIQFLDADDLLSHDKIEKQLHALKNDLNSIAVCSTTHFFDGEPHTASAPSSYEEGFINTTNDPVDFLIRLYGGYDFKASMVQTNAWLIPKKLIDAAGPWNENLTLDDDGEFFARVILAAKRIVKTEGINFYRKFTTFKNLSSQKNRRALESAVTSALLKKKYLLKSSTSQAAKKAAYLQLTDLSIKCYLQEPELYKLLQYELGTLPKYNYKPVMGGRLINHIANLFGWKTAKAVQILYRKRPGRSGLVHE
ncbi:glycosyltransferase family 2 protein [Mucilaginibacter pocheonensis]|uniref:Glycosyltransferase involved in cell wall biosynthesis n=1 Tax=Mucilaginibacter pocheonensis TaxID=398050 RepID=A0ABU1T4U5_9SPHI|nr:glycosyltransferase family 2 protein [Mucilaginibacter pocheonensis]MDR6940405.1 glycosyltransferase involved in cell wall biosynthesis [Mucilaginibacter pocheonensis]